MRFPIDCPSDCTHLTEWDMSVDDYTYYCDVLEMQIDGCDCGFKGLLPFCPWCGAEMRGEDDADD